MRTSSLPSLSKVAFVLLAMLSMDAWSQDSKNAAERELRSLLDAFLAGASRGDVVVHERFWDDDLVYTSSAGTRTDKQSILDSMAGTEPTDNPSLVYSAENVDIRVYGEFAVVAFVLVATPQSETEDASINYYFNTGTFREQDGQWRAIAWQATVKTE